MSALWCILLGAAIATGARGQQPLSLVVVSGAQGHDGRVDLAALGLGSGGLGPQSEWTTEVRRVAQDVWRTRGGVRIRVGRSVQIEFVDGPELTIDAQGRYLRQDKRLTEPALLGLALRMHDGAELRIHPGSARGAREVTLFDQGRELVLGRNGRPLGRPRRARGFHGLRHYACGQGDEIVSLTSLGPCLFVRPVLVHGRTPHRRLLVVGDWIRSAVGDLFDATPKDSVQYPLARKHAAFLRDLCAQLFPADQLRAQTRSSQPGVQLVFALGSDLRWMLRPFGRPDSLGVAFSLHLGPEAPASLEFVSLLGRTTLYRVLPKTRRLRSRYLGRGVDALPRAAKLLPWPLPLAHYSQRKRALRALEPWLRDGPQDKKVPAERAGLVGLPQTWRTRGRRNR